MKSEEFFAQKLRDGKMRYDRKLGRIFVVRPSQGQKPRLPEGKRGNSYVRMYGFEDGVSYYASAHRVIWTYFNGPIPDGMEIDHIDGVCHHNKIQNLRLATHAENMRYGIERRAAKRYPKNKRSLR